MVLLTLASAVSAAFTALCVLVVSSFLVLVLVPPRLHSVRARLRPLAVLEVENGLSWVVAAQRFQRPWLTRLFTQSSHSVSVTFYASFLPILFWLGFPELGRNLVFLMTLALYVGNAIKDLVCAPRPLGLTYGRQRLQFLGASDEEVELNAKEYGLPSSHTLNTLCLNYLCVWYLHDRQLIAHGTAALLYCLVAFWVMWIAASRLYLGLHTPVDILAGAVAGLAVLVCFIAIEGHLTRWLMSGPQAVLHAALASLLLLLLHPRPLEHTPSYEFSVSFMGSMFGIVAGVAWISPHAHQPGVQLAQLWSGPGRLLWAARRLCVGFAAVGVMKEVSRAALLAVLPLLYRFFPLAVRRMWQPPVHNLYKAPAAAAAAAAEGAPATAAVGQQRGEQPAQANGADGWQQQQQQQQQRRRRGGQKSVTADGGGNSTSTSTATTNSRGGAAPGDAAAAEQQPQPDPRLLAVLPHNARGMPWDVDVTARFFAYASIGVAVAGVTPRILDALGW